MTDPGGSGVGIGKPRSEEFIGRTQASLPTRARTAGKAPSSSVSVSDPGVFRTNSQPTIIDKYNVLYRILRHGSDGLILRGTP